MKADFSRLTFDPAKHYAGVLHQQGRVWLDSDWNEDILDRLHLLEEETYDIIGACGMPDPGTAFAITPSGKPDGDFLISGGSGSAGRYYVDGILCQLDASTSYLHQRDYPDPPLLPPPAQGEPLSGIVYLEVWRRLITYLEDDTLREIALGGPDTATRLKTIAQVKVLPVPASSLPKGTKLTCDNAGQFLPKPGSGGLTTLQPTNIQPDDLCRLPDPANYTGRENHLYRVEIHDSGDVLGSASGFPFSLPLAGNAAKGDTTLKLAKSLTNAQINSLKQSGVARLIDDDGHTESITVTGGSGASLNLASPLVGTYTTAKHASLTTIARFKWSRDNASFAVRVTAITDPNTLTLASLGRDQATALRMGDLVEISDDASDLGPARGHLTRLSADPDPDQLTVSIADVLPANFHVDRHLKLRRWDGIGQANTTFDPTNTPDMNFGDGVHIQFSGSDLRAGDYWQFAARALDGSVERLDNTPPMGITRHICPLAIIHWTQTSQPAPIDAGGPAPEQRLTIAVDEDCRQPFKPLTKQHGGECACDCAVAVAPGESLAAAVNKIGPEGGVICLLPGIHRLPETVVIANKVALTMRGAGAALIQAPPQSITALRFEHCLDITLRDLGFVKTPPSDFNIRAAAITRAEATNEASAAATSAAAAIASVNAVVTFVDCQAVAVTHCLVACTDPTQQRQGQSAGIFFGPSAAFESLPNRIQFAAQFMQGSATRMETVDPASMPAAPALATSAHPLAPALAATLARFIPTAAEAAGTGQPQSQPEQAQPIQTARASARAAAAWSAAAREARAQRTLALTIRDCVLGVAAGQHGVVIADSEGITLEDNWLLPMSLLPALESTGNAGTRDQSQRGNSGLMLVDSSLATLMNNVMLGFRTALLASSSNRTRAGAANVTMRGNSGTACGMGVVGFFSGTLRLSENAIMADAGPAVQLKCVDGEVFLEGNKLIRSPASGEATLFLADVAEIIAPVAVLNNNNFQSQSQTPKSHAVRVRGTNITYTANQSVCAALPIHANVMLQGQDEKSMTSITATSNTCREPAPTDSPGLAGLAANSLRSESNHIKLVNQSMGTSDASQQAKLQTNIAPLNEQWATLEKEFAATLVREKAQQISLLAVAGVSVTGTNLLSYNLVRLGRGGDQGSVSGVF